MIQVGKSAITGVMKIWDPLFSNLVMYRLPHEKKITGLPQIQ